MDAPSESSDVISHTVNEKTGWKCVVTSQKEKVKLVISADNYHNAHTLEAPPIK